MNATKKVRPSEVRSRARSPALETILEEAAVAFAEHGYHGMSMRDLARATRRSPATLYNYVTSKEDLLYAIQYDAFSELSRAAEAALDGEAEPARRFRALLVCHLGFFSKKPYLRRVLLNDTAALGPQRHQEIVELQKKYFELVRGVVEASLAARGHAVLGHEIDSYTQVFLAMFNANLSMFEAASSVSDDSLANVIEAIAAASIDAHSR